MTSRLYHRTTVDQVSKLPRKRAFEEDNVHQPETGSSNRLIFHPPENPPTSHLKSLKASAIHNVDVSDDEISEYSQRRSLALTPNPSVDPRLSLTHPAYGLPAQLVQNLAALGINSIYPWQSDCLLRSGSLRGQQNLVYTAPTGGGKSLVADIIMFKRLYENPTKKALLVLPYVALVQEKVRWLRKVVDGMVKQSQFPTDVPTTNTWMRRGDEDSIRVVGLFGGSKSRATWADMDIAVCTIEKANQLVNSSIVEFTVNQLAVVIIDELHMVDDAARGYILELMATKLLCLEDRVQLVCMSATLNNAELLARWLGNAKFYVSKYQPVPVKEYLVFENTVYPAYSSKLLCRTATQLTNTQSKLSRPELRPHRIIEASVEKELRASVLNSVVSLANETARAGYGSLIFCSSRSGSERDAELVSRSLLQPDETDTSVMGRRRDLLNDLRSTPTGLDPLLEKTVPAGVAFHHAGLTTEERDLIATAFDLGVIKVIVATCSLAAGINLPARRVILHGARMGAEIVGPSLLRQMRGRAGRKGKDEIGETYLCCQKTDLEEVTDLMVANIPDVESCLTTSTQGVKRALLEVIATKLATTEGGLNEYMQKTLLYQTNHGVVLPDLVLTTLIELKEMRLVEEEDSIYTATALGEAIVASALTPEDGLFAHQELKKSLGAFVLDSDIHALYNFTPIQTSHGDIDWHIFRKEIESFDESGQKVLSLVGVSPSVVNKMAQGGILKETSKEEVDIARIYRRFYAALQLRDLCNEMPVNAVARKYKIPRGIVQSLSQTCHGFAAGMIKFCDRIGWSALSVLLEHFSDRLHAGAKADLLALAQIQFVKSRTARVFWENGFKTVGAVAAATVEDIMPILLLAQPKKLRTNDEQEQRYYDKLVAKATQVVKSANIVWERQMRLELDEEE